MGQPYRRLGRGNAKERVKRTRADSIRGSPRQLQSLEEYSRGGGRAADRTGGGMTSDDAAEHRIRSEPTKSELQSGACRSVLSEKLRAQ